MVITTFAQVTTKKVITPRITTRVLFAGPSNGEPVLFLHGNFSSATWWQDTMFNLPPNFRGIAPDQRGYGAADPSKKIDATRGLGDLADDAVALLDHLGIRQAHIVGHSLGGGVLWWLLANYPAYFLSATLVAPSSPYGFGGTKDVAGTPCFPDYAGSGGGIVNPEFVRLVQAGDLTMNSPFSPRNILRMVVYKHLFMSEWEEELLKASLSTHVGSQDWPGDATQSPNWPYSAPGEWGPINALSPKYAISVDKLYAITPKPNILWIWGADDVTVCNKGSSDVGNLGSMGLIPGWPGHDVFPPQPMIDQTRAVLDNYAAAGGQYQEVIMSDVGHSPYLENPGLFNTHFHQHLRAI